MLSNTNRRRFMQLAGTGTALSIAGCNALQSDGTPTADDTDDSSGGETSGSATVTLQIQLGQQAQRQLQQQQIQVQSQIQSGELSQSEGQSRIREASAELYGDAIDSFQSENDGDTELTVEDSVEAFGVILVSGTPEALIDSLSRDAVGSLFAESTFQQAQSQAQQQTQAPSGDTTGTPSG
ncbi:hypothetical protein [Halorientalis sp.]|jgi:hypothetical protein|uniref:hypothetical protein n=1 Tax=Halorientalis sp. TaxID=1931229 RepID=UPI00261BCFC4|nr:hypothetical protein [Halorientalis sp.]